MIVLDPDPVVVMIPGKRVRVQFPGDGKPLSTTLPVATVQVGAVMVPTSGASGLVGCVRIPTLFDCGDIQPA